MKKLAVQFALASAFCVVAFAAKHYPLNGASTVPAAKGTVDVGKDKNGYTELKVKVEHLA